MNKQLKQDLINLGFEYQGQSNFILPLKIDDKNKPVIYAFIRVLKSWKGGDIIHLVIRNGSLEHLQAHRGSSLMTEKNFESFEELENYLEELPDD